MKIKDRIKELRRVKASELLPNPKNWRTHPKAQQDALRGVLADIGFADAALAYETDGGLMLVDGHLRVETASDAEIPVLVLDITDEEADKLLLTLDPLSSLAGVDAAALAGLNSIVEFESDAVRQMLENLTAKAGIVDMETPWDGDSADPADMGDYDPDTETYSLRVNGVQKAQKEEVVSVIQKAVSTYGLKVEVF
jgi:hypothetical protein